jgi:DNA-directed RNA polymerase specialized sigma24 family protein
VIPTGIPLDSILRTIDNVVNAQAYKFRFDVHDEDDIRQEGRRLAWEAIVNKYDESKPLENFLRVHIRNRLINFKRDNSKLPESSNRHMEQDDDNETAELEEIINLKLPPEYRADYLKLRHGCVIPKYRKEKILEVIREILGR